MTFFKRLDLHRQEQIAWIVLIVAMIIYILDMSTQSVLRYETFKATAFDLGNMDQVLWNTIHGRPFQFTNQAIDWYGPPNRLAVHVEPILLVISLLYLFHADPRILLIFQTLVLAAGAPAVFLISRRYLPAWPLLAVVMTVAYLLSPALLGLNIFDFHADSVATPLFLYAILAISNRRYIWFLILCVLACACKEDMPLAIAMFGILLIWKYRHPRLGLTLLIGGILWAYVAFKVVIPHFYTGVLGNNFWYRYETLGSTPSAAIVNLLIHPWLIFVDVFTIDRIYYLFGLLRSTGFLGLLAPEWLLPALPKIASNIVSTDDTTFSGVYQYNAAIIPFVMLAAIHGVRRLILIWQGWSREEIEHADLELLTGRPAPDTERKPYPVLWVPAWTSSLLAQGWQFLQRPYKALQLAVTRLSLPEWRRTQWQRFSGRMYPFTKQVSTLRLQWVVCTWLIFFIGLNYLITLPELNSFWATHWPGQREQAIQQILDMIPPDASVSASDDLNPHLSERQLLAVFPSVCLDATCDQTVQYIIVDLDNPTLANRAEATSELNAFARQFRLLANRDDIELFVRRST